MHISVASGLSLRSLAGSLLIVAAPGGAAWADGEFLQLDGTRESLTSVASVERRRLTYGATYYSDDEGRTLSASVLYQLSSASEGAPVTVKMGPSFGLVDEDDADTEAEIGLKLTVDRWIGTGFGGLFFQAEANTIDSSWFLLGQAAFTEPGLTLEVSRGASETYSETSVAISKRLGDGPVNLRVGHRFDAESWFVGASINTF